MPAYLWSGYESYEFLQQISKLTEYSTTFNKHHSEYVYHHKQPNDTSFKFIPIKYNVSESNSINNFYSIMSSNGVNKQREYFILLNRMGNNVHFPQHTVLTYSFKYGNVLYYCNFQNAGLGNNLLSYWFARGLAFFFNLNYQSFFESKAIEQFNTSGYIKNKLLFFMSKCVINDGRWRDGDDKQLRLEGFVPNSSSLTFNTYMAHIMAKQTDSKNIENELNKYSNIQKYLIDLMMRAVVPPNPDGNSSKYDGDLLWELDRMRTYGKALSGNVIHPWLDAKWSMFYLNDIMREIMHTDTEYAFELMLKQGLLANNYLFPIIKDGTYSRNINDITIHIRCGDIIRVPVAYNGFQTMKFFEAARDIIQHRANMNVSISDANVYIVMNILDDQYSWEQNNAFLDNKLEDHHKCRIYSNHILKHFREIVFKEYKNVYLVSNGTMYSDFYRIMHSSNIICGFSTFCLCGSLCNIKVNTVVLPDMWYKKLDFVPKRFILTKNIWISSRDRERLNLSATELAEYTISH